MKICISEQSVKDFNAFFKAKALELQKKNKYNNLNELYRALYHEALSVSGNKDSLDNHDVVIQHLALAPLALNNAVESLQEDVSKAMVETMSALQDPKKLETLINKMQDVVNTPVEVVEEEVKDVVAEADVEDYDANKAVHVHMNTTQGSETVKGDNSTVDTDKAPAHAAVRTVLDKVKNLNDDYQILAIPYNQLSEKVKGNLDFSISNKPTNSFGEKNTIVFIVVDKTGKPVNFDAQGNIVEQGSIPVLSPMSPSTTLDSLYQYFKGKKDLSQPLHQKFEAIEETMLAEGHTKDEIHELIKMELTLSKDLFAKVRERKGLLLDINTGVSTFGYNAITKTKTPTSDIANIENLTLSTESNNDGSFEVLTGGDLHETVATLIPNDLSTDEGVVNTIIELLTNPNLKTEDGIPLNAESIRGLVSNYMAVNKRSPLRISASGTVTIYGKKVNNPEEIRNFFNQFQPLSPVKNNREGRKIVTDLQDPKITSAMLYQDTDGTLYKVYKPKFSYNNTEYSSVSIKDGVVTTTPIEKKAHVVKTSSTKSFVNNNGVLKVYHPKLAYKLRPASNNNQEGLNKLKEQKVENAEATHMDELHALSWFEGSPLSKIISLKNAKIKSEDRPESRVAVARWVKNAIVLYAGSDHTDIYHEAWHAYSQGILSQEDTQKVYDAVKKLPGKSKLSNKDIEEYLAEEFRAYAIGKSKVKKNTILGKFFEQILNSLKWLVGKRSSSDLSKVGVVEEIVKEHFENLYSGNINTDSYSAKNFNFTTLNKNIEFANAQPGVLGKLNAQQSSLAMSTMDALIAEALDDWTPSTKDNSKLKTAYGNALDKIIELRNEQDALRTSVNPLKEASLFELYSSNFAMLDSLVENFGDVENLETNLFDGEVPTTFIGHHLVRGKLFNYNTLADLITEEATDEAMEVGEKLFERTGNEQSLFEMADEKIVYMLSTISKQETVRSTYDNLADALDAGGRHMLGKVKFGQKVSTNSIGVRQLERPSVVMAKLGKLLNSVPNGDMMYKKMMEAKATDQVVAEVLKKLGPYRTDDLNQTLLWSKFIQTFTKSHNKLQQLIMEASVAENGETIEFTSKYGSTLGGTKAVSRSWDASFPSMSSPHILKTKEGFEINAESILKEYLTETSDGKWKLKKAENYVNFYRALGVDVTDKPEIEKALSKEHDTVNAVATRLKNHVEATEYKNEKNIEVRPITGLKDLFGPHDSVSADGESIVKEAGLNSYYAKVQQIEFDLSDQFNSFMSINAPGDSQSELSLNNSASITINDINSIAEGTTIDEVIKKFPHLKFLDPKNDPFIRANRHHKMLFTKDGVRTDVKITLNNFAGSTLLQEDGFTGLTNMDLDANSKFMTDVYLSFFNKSEVVRMADKSTSVHIGIEGDQVFGVNEMIEAMNNPKDSTMYSELKDYLVAELVRMNILNQIKKDGAPFDKAYADRGGKLFIFDDIFKGEVKDKLLNLSESTDFNEVSKALSKMDTATLIAQVNEYFTTKTNSIFEENAGDLMLTDSVIDTMLKSLPEGHGIKKKTQLKHVMIGMFQRNKFIHNLDFTTLHLGDPALYNVEKEDFHKRNAGYISTGDLFRTDRAFMDFINARTETGQLKSRGWANKVTNGKNEYKDYDGRVNTAIIADHVVASEYLEEYARVLPGVDLGAYEQMEEGDGQGFISFDSYRQMSIAQGIWTQQQEEQYNLIVNRAITSEGKVTPGSYDQTKFDEFFPSMKLQYFGPMDTNAPLRQQAFHKFNLVPLIPGMIAGTKLEGLSKKMMEQGIDYMTFKSGSKLSTLSSDKSGVDQYYNKDRSLNDELTFEKNVIYAKYLKNQLKIYNKYKKKVTLPTQMRSILVSELKNKKGEYTGATKEIQKRNEKWHKNYLETLSEIRNYKEQELYNELGVKNFESLMEDSSKLVNMIRREFTSKDFTEDQIEFLFDNENLKSDLSTALTADQVQKLLVSMVDKRITKIKVNGEGLIQVASTMTEKTGTNQVKGDLEAGTNSLATYRNKDGKIKGMQIKIALQGEFEKLLQIRGLDGKRISQYITVTNADGTTVREMDYDLSLQRLNEAMKDEKWKEEHGEILRAVAPRIPSQAFNSIEFMEIAEFLPKNNGNIMIVPSEIVAKAGSDFDVDKLFTMFPNIDVYNGKAEIVKHTTINTDVEGLRLKIKESKEQLKKLKTEHKEELADLYIGLNNNRDLIELRQYLHKLYDIKKLLKGQEDDASKQQYEEVERRIEVSEAEQLSYYEELDGEYEPLANNKTLKAEISEIWTAINKIKMPQEKLLDEIDNYNRQIAGASIRGLENKLIDSIVDRLSMQEIYPELVKPNSNDLVEPLAKELADSATKYKKHDRVNGTQTFNKKGDKQISPTQIFDPMYNINKGLENAVGMDTLGVGAIGAKFASIFHSIGMYLNPTNGLSRAEFLELSSMDTRDLTKDQKKALAKHVDYKIGLDHNTTTKTINGMVEEVIDLSRTENISGERIADLLGQLINGWVDVAKDAWVFNIQGNKEVVPTLQYLLMAGVDFKQAVILSSSKLVREYIETKRQMSGAFYGLSQFKQNNENTHDLLQSYTETDALNTVLNENGYDTIDYMTDVYKLRGNAPLDMERLEYLVKNKEETRSKKDEGLEIQALMEFIANEQTAKQITNLTLATKFDTSTSASLFEVRDMKSKFDNLYTESALPVGIKKMMTNDSPVGMFNTNDLQLELWGQFFALRNHENVALTADEGYIGRYISGHTKLDNEKDFSEEFMSFLYQNEASRIHGKNYAGYNLNEVTDGSVEEVSFEDGTFHYNPEYITGLMETGHYGNSNTVMKFLIEKHIAEEKYDQGNVEETSSYKMAEEYMKGDPNADLREEYAEAEAILKSGSSELLFKGSYTYSNRLQQLKAKHPGLSKQYALVNDLTPDTKNNVENLYLINIKEEGYKAIYQEDLQALQEHPDSEISEFFSHFDHFAVLQSGVKSFGKYVLTGVINQDRLNDVVAPIKEELVKDMNEAHDLNIKHPAVDIFSKIYYKSDVDSFKRFLIQKNRGAKFESDFYFQGEFVKMDKTKLTLKNNDKSYVEPTDKEMLRVSEKVMIHRVTNFPVESYGEKSKVNGYYSYLHRNGPETLNNEYNSDTPVWIVGESLNEYAAGGRNNLNNYEEILKETFEKYKATIDSAIEQGVQTFNIGTSTGIDSMVRKYLKDKPGFNEHRIITKKGTFLSYSKERELTPDRLYSTLGGPVNVNDRFQDKFEEVPINMSIGVGNYKNVFRYIVARKSMLATPAERKRLREVINTKGEKNFTQKDWIDLVGSVKLGANTVKYDELAVLDDVLGKLVKTNARVRSDLKNSKKSLLTLGKGFTPFERNFGITLMELRMKMNGPVTPSEVNNIKLPEHIVDVNLSNKDGSKRLASTNFNEETNTYQVRINPLKDVQELFDYMLGTDGGPTSQQKLKVLEELEKQGYDMETLKDLLSTTELAETFLLLHEQDHIDNNDKDVYWAMEDAQIAKTGGKRDDYRNYLTPDKIAIETRASVVALQKIEVAKESGEDPLTCKF